MLKKKQIIILGGPIREWQADMESKLNPDYILSFIDDIDSESESREMFTKFNTTYPIIDCMIQVYLTATAVVFNLTEEDLTDAQLLIHIATVINDVQKDSYGGKVLISYPGGYNHEDNLLKKTIGSLMDLGASVFNSIEIII